MAIIVKAEGNNVIVQRVGDPSTRKGDPTFMHELNTAWEAAVGPTKQSLYPSVQFGGNGKIIRNAAKKDDLQLETYIESFADGSISAVAHGMMAQDFPTTPINRQLRRRNGYPIDL